MGDVEREIEEALEEANHTIDYLRKERDEWKANYQVMLDAQMEEIKLRQAAEAQLAVARQALEAMPKSFEADLCDGTAERGEMISALEVLNWLAEFTSESLEHIGRQP